MSSGAAALVGAGPGDPELLTLRAEVLLGLAGAVVVDASVAALARMFAANAVVVDVPDAQAAVGPLVAAVSRGAGPVVRLYRGDPWLHPGHAAERAALERAGVGIEAVAGVATEVAVPGLAGIPVNVRQMAVVCTLGPFEALPPARHPARTLVASGDDTVVMVRAIAARGDGDLPAALVPQDDPASAWRGALAAAGAPAAASAGPALLVVGAVCGAPPGASPSGRVPADGDDHAARAPQPGVAGDDGGRSRARVR